MAISLESIATRLEAIAITRRLEANAIGLEAMAISLEANGLRLEAIAISRRLEANAIRLEAMAISLEAMVWRPWLLVF